ncbi:hemolysin family protein [Anaerovorax sp. IOR16]|uniref:hemolysin family protein n=1 Tax=Anaerovorax sp. IOR16 TaxID=2773458 RepID=UPI002ED517FF
MMDSSPDPSMPLAFQLLFLALLILINAFFASAEMAFVSLNKNKIKLLANQGNKKAILLQRLIEEPNKFLSTIQVAITLAGFLSSASAATSMADDIGAFLHRFGIPYETQIAVVLVTLVLSYFTLVFGELFPKRLALQNAEKMALFAVKPILFISKIASPFVKLLSISVSFLLKITGKDQHDQADEYSEEEIRSLLEVGQESGQINETGREMINSIFEFDDKLAYEIMTPRTDVFSIDINDDLSEYIDELLEERYSRIPVYNKDSDDIIGILYMKDFILEARKHGFEKVDIRKILQKPFFVPESKKINELFSELQISKMHIAILIDEYGGFAGIVTMEDIIEEVMGNIDDEYDDDEPQLELIEENTYMVDGQYYLDDLSEELGLELESENHETIGGFVIDLLGEIPDEDETEERVVPYDGCIFKVESVKDRRIDKVRIIITPQEIISEEKEIESIEENEKAEINITEQKTQHNLI